MALKKVWVGGDAGGAGDWSIAANWAPVSLVNSFYSWTASGSGTNEYYLRTAGGLDPEVVEPAAVQEDGSALTPGTAGSLSAGEWDYADNDSLGYSTIYVRLSDGADPDSKVTGFVTLTDTPKGGDDVYIESGSQSINAGLDQRAITLAGVHIAHNYSGLVGLADEPLSINAARLVIGHVYGDVSGPSGSTRIHIDLGAATACNALVLRSGSSSADDGVNPIRLRAEHSSTDIHVQGGSVSIADQADERLIINKLVVSSSVAPAAVVCGYYGSGAQVTVTTATITEGELEISAAVTTLEVEGGVVTTFGGGDGGSTVGTANVRDGLAVFNSRGTLSNLNMFGGVSDFQQSDQARTVGTPVLYSGAELRANPDRVTFTNKLALGDAKYMTVAA